MKQQGTVYFIASPETGRVKIGFTTGNPVARMKALQTGSPTELTLLAMRRGTVENEQWLHHEFKDDRLHGEWFHPSDRLIAFMGYVCWCACNDAKSAGQPLPKWAVIGLEAIEEEIGLKADDIYGAAVQ